MRYGVIGGGILGLTIGYRLAQRGHDVVVFEQQAVPGGLASSFEVAPDVWLERFYHHLFRSDRAVVALIEELGLGSLLRWHEPVTTVLVDGAPVRLDSARSLLAFDRLSLADRLRTGFALAFLKVLPTPRPIDRWSADAWMRRACGAAAHEVVWGPLLEGKFGANSGDVSMAWLWARLHDRTTKLGYMDGGFHRLYAQLATAFERAGGRLVLDARVTGVEATEAGSTLTYRTGDTDHAEQVDRVVSTLPPALTARVVPGLDAWAEAARSPHPPLSAHCLVLALDRPLTGTYWIGAPGGDSPFLAVVEHTAMLSAEAYGGRRLVYLGAYRPAGDPWLDMPVDEQIRRATPFIEGLNPRFDPAWITDAWSFAAPFAQPIVDTDYRRRIPAFQTPVPNVWCASMFHVYPHDRGQNYSVVLAERLVRELAGDDR